MSNSTSKYVRVPVILLTAGIFAEVLALQNTLIYEYNNIPLGVFGAILALSSLVLERKVNK